MVVPLRGFLRGLLSPLCCILSRFWSEGDSWRNIMALKLLKPRNCLLCSAIEFCKKEISSSLLRSLTFHDFISLLSDSKYICAFTSPWIFFFCLILDFAVFWLVWSLSLLLFIQHGTNKELVPVHSTEDHFMPDTKWDRDCCAATVSELPMAWTVFKPHQVQRK